MTADPPPPNRPSGVQNRAVDAWRAFVPAIRLFAGMLAVAVAVTIYVRITGDHSPWVHVVDTAALSALVAGFAWCERTCLRRLLRVDHLRVGDGVRTVVTLAVAGAVVEAWFLLASRMFDVLEMLEPFRDRGWPPWTAVVLIVVAPATVEEIAFRGLLLSRLEPLLGRRDALILQATLFAILHLSPVVLPSHFVLGLALGYLRLRTGSLVPSMLAHAAWNLRVLIGEGLLAGW